MHHTQRLRPGTRLFVLTTLVTFALAASAARAATTPAPDNSKTTKEYLTDGMPALDKAWTGDDYRKAASVLQEIAKKDPTQLPRFRSKKSGEVFAQMIDQKNLDAFLDEKVPVDTRIQLAANMGIYAPVFSVYTDLMKPDSTYDAEALELGGFLLRAEVASATVLAQFKKAHNMTVDNAGFIQARGGFAQTAQGMIQLMMEGEHVRTSEAARFAGELKGYLPKLCAEMLPSAQEHLKDYIKQSAVKTDDVQLRGALENLLDTLK